jgi:glycosyltransferase involved in cell wall biosynthesis
MFINKVLIMNQVTPKITAAIITLNEEKNIADCLESVSWADELVVVDSGSTDRTVEIAKRYTDKVFVNEWKGQGQQKNRAAELATGPWIFSIDADERVSPKLAEEIKKVLASPTADAYAVRRKNIYRGQWIKHGGWWPDWVKRLFRKDKAHFNDKIIHDSLVVNGTTGKLEESLIHESFRSAGDFLERALRYSLHTSKEMFRDGKRASTLSVTTHAAFAFIKGFFLRAGFLDGTAGLLVAVSNAVGVFYRYMMLREMGVDSKCAPDKKGEQS